MNDLEEFLRDNKPLLKDNPTFILEAQNRMDAVEGIKAEVDRQRHHGRVALIAALAAGLALGVLVTLMAYLYPVSSQEVSDTLLHSIRLFLDTYKSYLFIPIAVLAIGLGFVLSKKSRAVSF